jgi:hemolysin activation/secretion protein
MAYGRAGYETLVSGQGTRVGAAYSRVHYRLHGDVDALDASGTAGVGSAWVKQVLVRGRQANLYLQLEYDNKRLRDRIGASDTNTDRHLDNWVLSVNGDLRDDLLGGGVNAWSVAWTRGHTGFDDAAAALFDAASAQTRGGFSKWNLNGSRLQRVAARATLYLNLGAQWANANLDAAEKMTVGGPYTVRAWDIGAVSGDTGYVASAELRHDLGELAAGSLQATAFVDTARVTINHRPWTGAGNAARLSGVGAGLTWTGPDAWRAALAVATPVGAEPAILGRQSSVRAWFTASKAF